jgi:hypothetical protein
MTSNITYNIHFNNNKCSDKLTFEELINLDIDCVTSIFKSYYKLDENDLYDTKQTNICLYTSEIPMSIEQYINNYRKLVNLYGTNALNEDDIKILEKFNK